VGVAHQTAIEVMGRTTRLTIACVAKQPRSASAADEPCVAEAMARTAIRAMIKAVVTRLRPHMMS
jgi:hypothetical protein